MIETKLLEVRDRNTFMSVMATKTSVVGNSYKAEDVYLFERAGFSYDSSLIIVYFLEAEIGHWNPYFWRDRTKQTAHKYIEDNWDDLQSGEVVDVKFILGETTEPKMSEKLDIYLSI